MSRKFSVLLSCLLIAAFVLSACGAPTASAPAPQRRTVAQKQPMQPERPS